jgi:hypothetical protein
MVALSAMCSLILNILTGYQTYGLLWWNSLNGKTLLINDAWEEVPEPPNQDALEEAPTPLAQDAWEYAPAALEYHPREGSS